MSRFEDYIRDIPMEIGSKFYPRPEIVLPPFGIPRMPDMTTKHDFNVELRARKAYDTRNDVKVEERKEDVITSEMTPTLAPSASTSSLPTSFEVLQPSRPDPKPASSEASSTEAPKPALSFEEFESKSNVFDELEWRSIDNRQALSQILNGISLSEPSTPNPAPSAAADPKPVPPSTATGGISLPSYPVLNFSSSAAVASSSVQLNGHNSTASYSKPSSENHPTTLGSSTTAASSQASKTSLRQRLLTKGYRENLVTSALSKVPHERIVHIEYYMKGMSTLEKRGVPVEASLTFLLETGVTDKQLVLKRAETADQLLSMGFDASRVFKALIASEGDRLKALEAILQS